MYSNIEAYALDPKQSGCRLRCHVSELLDSSRSPALVLSSSHKHTMDLISKQHSITPSGGKVCRICRQNNGLAKSVTHVHSMTPSSNTVSSKLSFHPASPKSLEACANSPRALFACHRAEYHRHRKCYRRATECRVHHAGTTSPG